MKKKIVFLIIIISTIIIFINQNVLKNNNSINNYIYDTRIPKDWLDNGIFKEYYNLAYEKLTSLSIDEKIGQVLLARHPKENQIETLNNYYLSGFIFYASDFNNKTEQEVKLMINYLQENSKIPLLTAVDEEGGKVIRISSNSNLVKNPFKSPSELYEIGGFEEIRKDTINKSEILANLGINLNLAPVVDIVVNKNDYMHERTLKEDEKLTSIYAKTVIKASKKTTVSYTLKHFPGYGNNKDTHETSSYDNRSYEQITNIDLKPFIEGIKSGAEAILISHNIVSSIDEKPASLSPKINLLLKNNLNFTGISITDDISMAALTEIENPDLKALQAGCDLIITSNYKKSFDSIKLALESNDLSNEVLDKAVFKVLAWKYYKKLLTK